MYAQSEKQSVIPMPEKPACEELQNKIRALVAENSALKYQNAALQSSAEKWEAFAENLHEVFYSLDLSGTVTYVSANLEDFPGFRPEEMMGHKYTDFVHPEDLPERDRQFGKVLEGGQVISEARYVKKDGTCAWTRTQGRPIYVKITVSDSGQGMNKEAPDNLFEPFFTTKETGRGTGLGMSTAYGIVKQHGGHIRASSEPGLGTTMKIYLPASAEPPDTQALSLQKDRTHRGSESILIAEDDQQVRNMASTALSRHGYQVLAAADGREALSLMKTHPGSIDLLLTDVIMPDINGKELFDRISAVHPDIRVLYMSGYTNDVIADHGVIDEGVHFLEKPFHIKTLAAKVRAVLDQ